MTASIQILHLLTTIERGIRETGFLPTHFELTVKPAGFCQEGSATFELTTRRGQPLAPLTVSWKSDVTSRWMIKAEIAGASAEMRTGEGDWIAFTDPTVGTFIMVQRVIQTAKEREPNRAALE